MALAPLANVLYSRVMKHDPHDPAWPDRDRFVLSNGHASILQYSMLYLSGYGLELADIEAFRSYDSRTPGHPEARHTPGIEVTTGPLGQGFGDAVGMAIAERVLRDRFGSHLVDHHTYVIAGDGCFMEGVSHEAASLAGHLGLGRLICVFDDNRVTIDGTTELSNSDDVGQRFEAYGWNVEYLGEIGDDCDALEAALLAARADESRPSLLVLRSHIGTPSPDHTDDPAAHANPFTPEDVTRTKEVMGIPDEPFWAPNDLVTTYRDVDRGPVGGGQGPLAGRPRHARRRRAGGLGRRLARHRHEGLGGRPAGVRAGREDRHPPGHGQGAGRRARPLPRPRVGRRRPHRQHRRQAARRHRAPAAPRSPAVARCTTASASTPWARRPSAWPCTAASCRSPARSSSSLDYMRPPVRLASISRAQVVFVFSHDSVGVGEDGPTHQPVEHLATLRAMPGPPGDPPGRRQRDRRRVPRRGRPRRRTDGDRALAPGHPDAHRRLGRRARRRHRRRRRRPGAGDRGHRQRGVGGDGRRRAAHRRRPRHPCRQPAELGPLRRPGPASTATSCCRRASRSCRWRPRRRSVGSATPTTPSASIASASARPATRCCTASASTSTTWCSGPGRS